MTPSQNYTQCISRAEPYTATLTASLRQAQDMLFSNEIKSDEKKKHASKISILAA
jgi:Tfp pilus assembly ATPase PilU